MVQIAILQGLQIATVLLCAPLLRGIINRLKAIVQSRRGPSVWQPYRDLWKLLLVVNQTLISAAYLYNPAHWLLAAALFMVILAETGRIPVDNPSSTFELSMIEASRTLEYSGQELALMEWGG